MLVALGALNLYATSGWQSAARHLAVAAPGLVLLVALRRMRIDRLAGLGWGCYGLSVALLAAVPFVGVATKGARRWIGAGAFSVQPSELAKLGLLLVLAHVLTSDRPPGRRFLWAVGVWAVPTGLTLLQPDLSTALLLTTLLAAMLILARIPWRYLLPPGVAVTLLIVWRMALAGRGSRTSVGMLIGAGLAVLFGTQVAISVAGNLGLLPIAGIPFPLVSYGGTAAIVYLGGFGVVLAARRDGARRRLWAPPRWARTSPRWLARIALSLTVVLLACAGYGRHVQIARGASLLRAARTQMTRCVSLPAPRGLITDRHGALLAGNADQSEVAAIPAVLRRDPAAVNTLADL